MRTLLRAAAVTIATAIALTPTQASAASGVEVGSLVWVGKITALASGTPDSLLAHELTHLRVGGADTQDADD